MAARWWQQLPQRCPHPSHCPRTARRRQCTATTAALSLHFPPRCYRQWRHATATLMPRCRQAAKLAATAMLLLPLPKPPPPPLPPSCCRRRCRHRTATAVAALPLLLPCCNRCRCTATLLPAAAVLQLLQAQLPPRCRRHPCTAYCQRCAARRRRAAAVAAALLLRCCCAVHCRCHRAAVAPFIATVAS